MRRYSYLSLLRRFDIETRQVSSVFVSLNSKSVFKNCPRLAAASSEGRVSLKVGETLVGGTFCIHRNVKCTFLSLRGKCD